MVNTRRQSRRLREQKREDEAEKSDDSWASASASPVGTPAPPSRRNKTPSASTATTMTPNAAVNKTPQTGIKPDPAEMHPSLYRSSTSTPYDEAAWLGFFKNDDPKTEPAKRVAAPNSPTPVKSADNSKNSALAESKFQFTFKNQPAELSPQAKKMMEESRAEAARIREQMVKSGNVPGIADLGRKILKPKGKASRFSDVHLAEFKKMDSIANHPSKWRTNNPRLQSTQPASTASLKRSPSRAELDKPESLKSLKRSPSKAELDKPAAPKSLKRTPSKASLHGVTGSPQVAKSAQISYPSLNVDALGTPSAKRVRISKADDVGSRAAQSEARSQIPTTPDVVRPRSGFLTPTRAAMARSASTKPLRTTQIPALVRSKSEKNLMSPVRVGTPQAQILSSERVAKPPSPTPVKVATLNETPIAMAPLTATPSPKKGLSRLPMKIKSILRTPHRLYSNDPSKIAAGTHMATPPLRKSQVPATEPVRKHVDFTASIKEKAERDEAKAISVEPEVGLYPEVSLYPEVDLYPALPGQPTTPTLDRRSTLSSVPMPGAFSFRSPTPVRFPPSSTIRPVRSSDADVVVGVYSPPKRKLDTMLSAVAEVAFDGNKENMSAPETMDDRPAKKFRRAVTEEPRAQPESKAPMVQRVKQDAARNADKKKTPAKRGLTASRLAFLAMPKKHG